MSLLIVYASVATEAFSDVALGELVGRSRTRNEQRAITSVLLHQRGAFLHGIEGAEADVRALLASLYADPRHRNARVLVEVPLAKRIFSGQPMSFFEVDLGKIDYVQGGTERPDTPALRQGFSWQGCIALQLLAPYWS